MRIMGRPSTPEQRLFALGKALRHAWWPRQLAAIAIATPVALAPAIFFPHGADFLTVPLVLVAAALGLQWLFLGRRLRAAMEAFSWVGRWEWLRARAEFGDPFPSSPHAARSFVGGGELPRHPAAVDLLVGAGDYEAARRLADELPADTEWERFERQSQRAWVEWVVTGADDGRPEAEAAADKLDDPEDRLRAEAVLALAAARERFVAGGDWKEPLVGVRERIGTRADGILRHQWWTAQASLTAALAVGYAIVFALPT